MISVDVLLNAVRKRTMIWEFHDIYSDKDKARHEAARLFAQGANGTLVKKSAKSSYIVLVWEIANAI
jgi:hypothetical protein